MLFDAKDIRGDYLANRSCVDAAVGMATYLVKDRAEVKTGATAYAA